MWRLGARARHGYAQQVGGTNVNMKRPIAAIAWCTGVALAAHGITACSQPTTNPAALAASAVPLTAPGRLPTWEPSAKQQAVLASLPQDVAAQREEIIRLAKVPLPSYEERRRLLDLLGDGFPNDHPLRENEAFLLQYYRTLPKPSKQELDELISSLKQRMIFVKGGRFIMGDFGPMKLTGVDKGMTITGDSNNQAREVVLDSFSIMKGRVTYGEFDLYTRDLGLGVLRAGDIVDAYDHRPGYTAWPITWPQADGYCKWLAKIIGLPFKLPTEAQWEYAAREGGAFIAYPMHELPGVRWQNSLIPDFRSVDEAKAVQKAKAGQPLTFIQPRPTSLTGQNRIGMEGVVGGDEVEWVSDWYQEDYYRVSPRKNPAGPKSGTLRVARTPAYTWTNTVLSRRGRPPDQGNLFRCVLDARQPWH